MNRLAVLGGTPYGRLNVPPWPVYGQEEADALVNAVRSGIWGYRGPRELEFEKAFACFCGTRYAVAVTNGTHSLRLALEALGIGPGDEVIVPGSTWQATAASVLDVNAVPVLVDMDPGNYCLDAAKAEAAVNSRTRCVIPVHLYGRVCDMDAVTALARKYGLAVIEDCSHQHGSEWRGRKVGGIGDIGSFSLQASKILNTGEGGMLTTDDERLYLLMQSLKNCGRPETEGAPTMQSGNYRMSEFQAAIGLCQLERLPEQNARREENARYLEDRLARVEGIEILRRDERITFQAYYMFSFKYKCEKWENVPRDAFVRALRAETGDMAFIGGPYEPLNDSPLYRPLSKRTHKLSDDYMGNIDPSRFALPECDKAYRDESVQIFHSVLLAERTELDKLAGAVQKIRDNLGELRRYAQS